MSSFARSPHESKVNISRSGMATGHQATKSLFSSLVSENTVLLTVVDSSTGRTLGECTTQSHGFRRLSICRISEYSGNKWVKFQWALAADSMQCTVSPTNSSRVVFPAAPGPRTFSVRIQAGHSSLCFSYNKLCSRKRPGVYQTDDSPE